MPNEKQTTNAGGKAGLLKGFAIALATIGLILGIAHFAFNVPLEDTDKRLQEAIVALVTLLGFGFALGDKLVSVFRSRRKADVELRIGDKAFKVKVDANDDLVGRDIIRIVKESAKEPPDGTKN